MLKRLVLVMTLIMSFTACSVPADAAPIQGRNATVPTITLIMPQGGGNIEFGKDTPVAWKYSGYPDSASVRVSLVKDGEEVGIIANNVPIKYSASPSGNGALPDKWQAGKYLGGAVAPGGGYKIRVRVNQTTGQDESNLSFNIIAPGAPPSLKLTVPDGKEKWELGHPAKISWNSTGITGQLRITLLKNGMGKGIIAKPSADAGSFDWTVGTFLPPYDQQVLSAGADYKLRIETLDGSVKDESNAAFTISAPAPPLKVNNALSGSLSVKTIAVTSPGAITLNRIGEVYIAYQYSENLKGSYIKISLIKAGVDPGIYSYVIQKKWPINSGKFHWNLPGYDAGVDLGVYKVRVQSLDYPDVYGDSAPITFAANEHVSIVEYSAKISNQTKYHAKDGHGHEVVKFNAGGYGNIGSGTICIGYSNQSHDENQINYVYRSFFQFDLKQLKGKVNWAKLSFDKNDGTPDANKPLYYLTIPWNGSSSDLFAILGNQVNYMDTAQLTGLVQKWIDDPSKNFGAVMMGPDESMAHNNKAHIMHLANVKLVFEIKTNE